MPANNTKIMILGFTKFMILSTTCVSLKTVFVQKNTLLKDILQSMRFQLNTQTERKLYT